LLNRLTYNKYIYIEITLGLLCPSHCRKSWVAWKCCDSSSSPFSVVSLQLPWGFLSALHPSPMLALHNGSNPERHFRSGWCPVGCMLMREKRMQGSHVQW